MTSRAFHVTRIACAVAALGVSLSVHAQYRQARSVCVDASEISAMAMAEHRDDNRNAAQGCIRPLSDNRAAVLLPSALEEIDRVPTDESLRRHAWGFLDGNGKLAINPQFEAVGDFHHGLAAVRWKGKWGYIDAKGKMAVPPRYDSVSDFVEAGLAVVTLNGNRQLIDRGGRAVGDALDASVQTVELGEGKPAQISISYREEYRSNSGERRYATDDIRILSSYGPNLFIAADAHGMYGLLDTDWNWRVTPQYSDISRRSRSPLALAIGDDEVALIDASGNVIGQGKGYRRLIQVGQAFWSAELPRRGYVLLDAAGQPLGSFTDAEAQSTVLHGNTLVYATGDTLKAYVPGCAEALTLGTGLTAAENEGDYVLFRDAAQRVAGILTPKGVWLHGDTAPAWLAKVDRFVLRQGKLWLSGNDGELFNALDADGREILQADALAAAQGSQLRDNMPLDLPGGPLGLLGQGYCQCGDSNAGLLLADGSVATDKAWTEIVPLDGPKDEYGAPDEASNTLTAEQLRFAAQTEDGMQLLDARGKPMDLPPQQHIGDFRHGYALIYAKGEARIIDRAGKAYALPDYFETEVVAPGLVRYLKTAAEGDPWGLYDFIAGKEVAAPAFQFVDVFQDGQAVASLGADKVGVIDQQGKWIVPPTHHGAKRVSDKLWLVSQTAWKGDDYQRPQAVINTSGHPLTTFQSGMDVSRTDDGAYLAYSQKQRWMISPDASDALDMKDAGYTPMGSWMAIRRANRHGYLDGAGRWQIAPGPVAGTPFQGKPARALLSDDDGARLIDEHGKTVASLPAGEWSWPAGSPWLVLRDQQQGKHITHYADLTGKTRMTLAGFGSGFSEGRAVMTLPNGTERAVNDKAVADGPVFDYLGLRRDGLAVARVGGLLGYADGQGKLAIAPVYLYATPFSGQRAVVSTRDMSMILDNQGAMVARVGMECGIRTLYGAYNQRLWPLSMPQRCRQ